MYISEDMWIYLVVSNDLQLGMHIILAPYPLLVDIRVLHLLWVIIYIYITIYKSYNLKSYNKMNTTKIKCIHILTNNYNNLCNII